MIETLDLPAPTKFPEHRAHELMTLSAKAACRVMGFDDDDLAGEVCHEAIRDWHKYDPKYPLATWVGQIAYRRNQDRVKKSDRERQRIETYSASILADADSVRATRGRPGITDAQSLALLRLAQQQELSAPGVHGLLKLRKDIRKVLGLDWLPSIRTLRRAISWAKKQ